MAELIIYVVTGATRGIGRAVAVQLVRRGFRVVAIGRSGDLLASLADECGKLLVAVSADLSCASGIETAVASVGARACVGGIVHCAGSLVPLERYGEISGEAMTEHFRIHVAAPGDLFRNLARRHRVERIMFIDSYSAGTPRMGWGAYSIVKAAAQMAARCAAQELSKTRVIRVFPGAVNTRIVDTVLTSDTETAAIFAGIQKRGELAEPGDVAEFLTRLLVDAPDQLLRSQEAFDYNSAADRERVGQLSASRSGSNSNPGR